MNRHALMYTTHKLSILTDIQIIKTLSQEPTWQLRSCVMRVRIPFTRICRILTLCCLSLFTGFFRNRC